MKGTPPDSADAVARLRVKSARGEQLFALAADEMTVGRSASNDVRIEEDVMSGAHARLTREGAGYRFVQIGQTNPTLLRGEPVTDVLLQHGDRLEVAPGTDLAVEMVFEIANMVLLDTLDLTSPFSLAEVGKAGGAADSGRLALPESGSVTIGRAPGNDLTLQSLSVSRVHARIEIEEGAARLIDQESANGTYVNGLTVQTRDLVFGDIIRIGPYKLVYRPGALEHHDDSLAVRLDVHNVTKAVSGGRTLLSAISMNAHPGEVVAIAGTSGAGKSTLIGALTGMHRPSGGHILVNGADLYQAYDALRPLIGYVPQETILPGQLATRRALQYVARLRLPPDVSSAEADRRVDEVMLALGLEHRAGVQISRLSGGQQKRASIAAELIARPGLLFLDEPTSGLDPGFTRRVTGIIRELAQAGSTVVIVSHDTESVQAADRIVFLARGGHVVFNGSPEEAIAYFGVEDFAEIYDKVEAMDPEEAESQLHASRHYREKVAPGLLQATPLEGDTAAAITFDPVSMIGAGVRRGASTWRQFRIMTSRYVEATLGDRGYLALLLAQAPIIAFFLALVAKSGDFHPPPAGAVSQATALGVPAAKLAAPLTVMLAASATWFGAINAAREIVKELPILRRERLAGLRVAPYLASKFVVLAVLCSIQTALLLAIVMVKVRLPSSGILMPPALELWMTLELASLAALGLGLAISASMSNADRAQSLVPIVLIPQLIFVGGAGSSGASEWLSYLTVTHWSSQAMKITGGIPYLAETSPYDAEHLLVRWAALAVMAVVFLLFAAWRLGRERS